MRRADTVASMQRELVERAIGGDRDAFSSLVTASVDRLYAVATLIVRDSDRAQDAVQEALVSAWKDVRGLRNPDAWGAWLYRLTVWSCYRVARKEKRRSLVELHAVPDPEPTTPFDAAAALADRDLVERLLKDLSLDHRAAIVLRFYLDLPVEEVAQILGIPIGTAKSRIHYGVDALRASLATHPDVAIGRPQEVSA
jgi:RNA polymerase sigma factor (sigma-70 family)